MGKSKDLATGETRFVNTAGDTMTGALTGTSAGFTGDVNIGNNASSNPLSKLRLGGTQYGAADIRPTDEGGHKVGMAFYTDGTGDTTIDPVLRMTIDSSGRVTKPSQPAFNAYRNTSLTTNTGSTHTLVPDYTGTRFNHGSHFNTSNGRFTAPVDGEYLFGVNNNMGSGHNVKSWRLHLNGSVWIILSYADLTASWQNLSASTLVTLNANDYIQFGYRGQPDYGNDWLNVYGYLMG